jgi:hypothetical protein
MVTRRVGSWSGRRWGWRGSFPDAFPNLLPPADQCVLPRVIDIRVLWTPAHSPESGGSPAWQPPPSPDSQACWQMMITLLIDRAWTLWRGVGPHLGMGPELPNVSPPARPVVMYRQESVMPSINMSSSRTFTGSSSAGKRP